ncbi:MAG: CBS domain-containing protein, partial [Bacteroidota bacterium]
PIYDKEPEDYIGFILKDQLLESIAAREEAKTLEDFKVGLLFVTEIQPVTEVMDILMSNKAHMAMVRDEYGVVGLVTLEDIFETLLGLEIVDETDKVQDMQKLARELWQKRFDRIKR